MTDDPRLLEAARTQVKIAAAGGLASLGLAGVALVAFATRRNRVALAALGGAGLAWWAGNRMVKSAVATVNQ